MMNPIEDLSAIETARLKQLAERERLAELQLSDLGLAWEDLRDKKVLDVGAGGAEIARLADSHGCKVFSLGKDGFPKGLDRSVKSRGESMPFASDAFDLVLSHAVFMPGLFRSLEIVKEVLEESVRVTRPGGEVRFNVDLSPESAAELWFPELESLGNEPEKFARETRKDFLIWFHKLFPDGRMLPNSRKDFAARHPGSFKSDFSRPGDWSYLNYFYIPKRSLSAYNSSNKESNLSR